MVRSSDPVSIGKIAVCVRGATYQAHEVLVLALASLDGLPLPEVAPGSHVDVYLQNGIVRQYSLITPLCSLAMYTIAVKLDREGRGGSLLMHKTLKEGEVLSIGYPRNNFVLNEDAQDIVLFAGGIGITPIYSMFTRLQEIRSPVTLHYWCKSPEHALFYHQLADARGVHVHYSGEHKKTLTAVLSSANRASDLYCCGPTRMLLEFEIATSGHPRHLIHVEHFKPRLDPCGQSAFNLHLAKSGRELVVPEGVTILDCLREASIDVPYSCEEGVCGACEAKVLSGTPAHRDTVRTASEHNLRSTMMICCSGSLSERLVLDL